GKCCFWQENNRQFSCPPDFLHTALWSNKSCVYLSVPEPFGRCPATTGHRHQERATIYRWHISSPYSSHGRYPDPAHYANSQFDRPVPPEFQAFHLCSLHR